MDVIVFALLLAVALVVVFRRKRWLVVTSWGIGAFAAMLLFLHHVTSVLPLSF
ncbi:DUF5993 family protein [Leifsonia xyli]|jgi:hypothetical protein|uniref:DUF5993 family protein n=1 Tax=Leifsonia xyli TaxID=1575 RepID=UPI0003F7E144|nr:DUF5993 family protein [Leifsonia xyli]